ncbi:hypothetical protein niasHT_032906 [Heterodera trifolii]|uniref:Uncharacterized protein n=1 Tax=Heterodera trifolii TaxID=157864 RepID=A0ABD2IN25_9BILA
MAKAIFISGDCWLCVFDLLPPRQLGLGIALISHRFDVYVDEHFKTRKWTLGIIEIRSKMGENGTKKMEIVIYEWEPLPIPKIQLPRKVIGFGRIEICYIDQNAIAFLHHFRQLFTKCSINLSIKAYNDRSSELILRNIWPMIVKNIHGIELSAKFFRRLRQFVPSILNDCPSLGIVKFRDPVNFFIEFPADDSAAASDGQVVAKWLFTALPNNVPKVFKCVLEMDYVNLASTIDAFKTAFASASSPANFIVVVWFYRSPLAFSIAPFGLINELTREQLTLKKINNGRRFVFVRCPIARDENKWAKWEEKAIVWQTYEFNRIAIYLLLDEMLGPIDHY